VSDYNSGQHVGYIAGNKREFHLVVDGSLRNDEWLDPYEEVQYKITGSRCIGSCVEEVNFDVDAEDRVRYWSNPLDWKDEDGEGAMPEEGQEVHILPEWNMVYDLEGPSPIYELVRINGNVTFMHG